MMSFLRTGKTLYVLMAICLAGVSARLMTESFYRRLAKEGINMALTKSKYLRRLKQNAEDIYHINQGMDNTRVYLERQIYSLRTFGMSVRGLDNLSGQLTLLYFLAGGGATFLSYWFRSDNYYIVLYDTTSILAGIFTMLMDYGVNLESRRQQLFTCLQDYLKNVMWPRINRENTAKHVPAVTTGEDRREPANLRPIGRDHRSSSSNRRGLEQTATSREEQRERSRDDWLQDLNPERKRTLGGLLKEFIP